MDINIPPPNRTPIQRVINFYLKESSAFFDGRCYRSYNENKEDFVFLEKINRVYFKSFKNLTTMPLEEIVEEAAVFYILDHLHRDCRDPRLFEEKAFILDHYFQAYMKLGKLDDLDEKEKKEIWIKKVALKVLVDYQATIATLLEIFDIKSPPLKIHLIKTCLLNPNNLTIRQDFWEACIDPQNLSESFFMLERSHFNQAIHKLTLSSHRLDHWGSLYFKDYFFHELWNHDFLHEDPKTMLIKLPHYPFDDHEEMIQYASKALFFSTKENPHLNFLSEHELLLPYWKFWITLIIPFFNRGETPSYRSIEDLNNKNQCNTTLLKHLIVRHWEKSSSLLTFLTPLMTKGSHTEIQNSSTKINHKEKEFNEENGLIWLSLVAFFFAAHRFKDEDIRRHLEPLEELRCHPEQHQRRHATYYYLYGNTQNNFKVIFEDFIKTNIPLTPALFCAQYLSKHPWSIKIVKKICLTFFSSKYRHDRRHQSYFCSWIQRFNKIKKMEENEIVSLLTMLSKAKTRKILFSALETVEMFFNLHLFRTLTSYENLDQLLEEADQIVLKKFDLVDTENLKNLSLAMKTFRQPRSLFIYYGKIKSWGHDTHQTVAVDFFHRFLTSLAQGTFAEDRYDIEKNSVLKKFHAFSPEAFLNWKVGATFRAEDLPNLQHFDLDIPHKIIVSDSDDPSDLFLSGTEVLHSCQNVHTDIVLSCALLGYVWNGNRIFVIKDPETNEIIARAINRIMPDSNGKIVIVLEKIHYRCAKKYESFYASVITQAAIERAKALKLPLLTIRTDGLGWETHLLAEGLYCPFDYSDASVGNGFPTYKGSIEIHSSQLTCLYDPS